jgi:uncharacterized protein YukE
MYKVSWADQHAAAAATTTAVGSINGVKTDIDKAKGLVTDWQGESQAAWNVHQQRWDKYIANIIDALQDFEKALTASALLSEGAEKKATQIMTSI